MSAPMPATPPQPPAQPAMAPAMVPPSMRPSAHKELEGLESLAKYNEEERKRIRFEQRKLADVGNSDEDEDEEEESIRKREMKVFEVVPTSEKPWSEANVLSRAALDKIQKAVCPEFGFTERQLEYISHSGQELLCDAVDELLLLASHRAGQQGAVKISVDDVNNLLETASTRSSGLARIKKSE